MNSLFMNKPLHLVTLLTAPQDHPYKLRYCNSYLMFCNLHNLPIDPTPDTLSFFTVFMSHHIHPKSVDNYLSGICNNLEGLFPDICAWPKIAPLSAAPFLAVKQLYGTGLLIKSTCYLGKTSFLSSTTSMTPFLMMTIFSLDNFSPVSTVSYILETLSGQMLPHFVPAGNWPCATPFNGFQMLTASGCLHPKPTDLFESYYRCHRRCVDPDPLLSAIAYHPSCMIIIFPVAPNFGCVKTVLFEHHSLDCIALYMMSTPSIWRRWSIVTCWWGHWPRPAWILPWSYYDGQLLAWWWLA